MNEDTSNTQPETGLDSSAGMVTQRLPEEGATQAGQGRWGEVSQDWREVGEEFVKLGSRLSSAIRSGWKTEEVQQLHGLSSQLRAMADQVEAAVRAARQEATNPETKAQTQRVVAAAKEAQTTLFEEVRVTVAAGLRALNAQLRELADRIESGRK